jgi:hypothetical protein
MADLDLEAEKLGLDLKKYPNTRVGAYLSECLPPVLLNISPASYSILPGVTTA